ncbi:MAG: hypothetical protein QXI89_00405 [Candidatus Anstonellales archaeon]
MKNMKKGQYFSFDVLIAGVIAILAFGALLLYWQYSIEQDPSNIESIRREAIKHMLVLTSENENYSILVNNTPILKNDRDIKKSVESYINDFSITGNLCVKIGKQSYGKTDSGECIIGIRQAKIERLFITNDTENVTLVEFYFSR